MLQDRYGNTLSTPSPMARDAYVRAVDLYLAAQPGVAEAFQDAIDADEGFALAHLGLARDFQARGLAARIAQPLARARICVAGASARELSHVHALGLLLDGSASDARAAVETHVTEYPRDAMVAQACTGVFGLIGFSGLPGREAAQLDFTARLAPHYGDDWWFLSQHAFAQLELGHFAAAEANLATALAGNPASAHTAHIKAHLLYETGEAGPGLRFLDDWRQDYARGGLMHCHLSWHVALWALEAGDIDRMWAVTQADIDPASGAAPPLNVLTDMVAILFRAELAGVPVPRSRWRDLSAYARLHFPKPGLAFADVHSALAHAMAGDTEGVERITQDAKGPAAGVVAQLSRAFLAMSRQDWSAAADRLLAALPDQARIGGSNAQRDLVACAYAACLARTGRADEAARFLAMARPNRTSDSRVLSMV